MSEFLSRRNSVLAALRAARRSLHRLWIQDDIGPKAIDPILKAAAVQGVPISNVGKQELNTKTGDSRHQGVLLEAGPFVYAEVDEMIALAVDRQEKPFLLILDLLHGPQNIGALLRTAEICGVHGVIVQDRRAPEITPTVVQYSAGAAEFLLINQATNLSRIITDLQERDIWVAGLDLDEDAQPFGLIDLDLPIALVVGHEGSGLRRLVRERCDFVIRLPMRGQTESLNAAVAGSILLYASWQARGFPGLSSSSKS